MPLMVGGPDMAKNMVLFSCVSILGAYPNFIRKNKLKACYVSSVSTINNNHSNNLGSYLAGLFEGDGHIWIQKQKGSKTHNPRFCITFSLKNEALCKKLLEIVGFGFIRYKLKDNACVLVVSPVLGLKKIVNLINGELKTPTGWCGKLPKVGKNLSNSGDSLKLMSPNFNWKIISGWFNQLCKVIVYKILEIKISDRGSNSVTSKRVTVKEQRVDGRIGNLYRLPLRCTLKGFERNYPIKIPFKQLYKVKYFSTNTTDKTSLTLKPWF